MNGFSISEPAESLLRAALLDPRRLNHLMDERVAARRETLLRPAHPYLARVRRRTEVPLMMVARRRRHLLIEIESRSPFWRYREHSRHDCQLLLRCEIPETVASGASGLQLGKLVAGLPFLSNLVINTISSAGSLVEFKVEPNWNRWDQTGSARRTPPIRDERGQTSK